MSEFNCYKATSAAGKRRSCDRCGIRGRLEVAEGHWWITDSLCNGCATAREIALDGRRLYLGLAAYNLQNAIHSLDEAIEELGFADKYLVSLKRRAWPVP